VFFVRFFVRRFIPWQRGHLLQDNSPLRAQRRRHWKDGMICERQNAQQLHHQAKLLHTMGDNRHNSSKTRASGFSARRPCGGQGRAYMAINPLGFLAQNPVETACSISFTNRAGLPLIGHSPIFLNR
jgi:hypothetical protein